MFSNKTFQLVSSRRITLARGMNLGVSPDSTSKDFLRMCFTYWTIFFCKFDLSLTVNVLSLTAVVSVARFSLCSNDPSPAFALHFSQSLRMLSAWSHLVLYFYLTFSILTLAFYIAWFTIYYDALSPFLSVSMGVYAYRVERLSSSCLIR